jgi:hypothetical protein
MGGQKKRRQPAQPPRTFLDRSAAGRYAARIRWSRESGVDGTVKARAAGPGSDAYWLDQVDPGRSLDPAEARRRAQSAKTAFYERLAAKRWSKAQRDAGAHEGADTGSDTPADPTAESGGRRAS